MIYIIRHGQTDQNVAHRIQGQRDFPLNEAGEEQAREAAARLKARGVAFDRAYSSPLMRAARTAEIIGGEVPIIFDDRLKEMHFGRYEGEDLKDMPPELEHFFKDFRHNPAPEGVEQLDEIKARLGSFLEDLRAEIKDTPDINILISTHAIALKAALEYLEPGADGRWWETFIRNCGIYTFELKDGTFTVPEEWI